MGLLLVTVPNISEGRDLECVARVASSMSPHLLDVHSDRDHHRSVLTAAASPEEIEEAVVSLARSCIDDIDIRVHEGAHPRVGSLDVIPLVPRDREQYDAAVEVSLHLGRRLSALRLGVYRYDDQTRPLPSVRRSVRDGAPPDFGAFHPTAGSVCLGVRWPLVAFNVDLSPSAGRARAQAVAAEVRSDSIRALAFVLPRQQRLQVSMNLIDPEHVGIESAWRRVTAAARLFAAGDPVGAEVVGLVPRAALIGLSDELAALTRAREKVLEDRLPVTR